MPRLSCSLFLLTGSIALTGCAGALYPSPPRLDPVVPPQEIAARIILLGDAGDVGRKPDASAAVLRLVQEDAAGVSPSAVIFLGDNIYPSGMPPADDRHRGERDVAERTLRAQVEASRGAADAVFVPGNHDWDQAPASGDGVTRLKAAAAFLATVPGGATQVRMLPADGCPGPIAFDVGSALRVVAIDTEWLLAADEAGRKPLNADTGCRFGVEPGATAYPSLTRESFYDALGAMLRDSGTRQVLVVAHHPLESHGPHGGYGLSLFFNKENFSSRAYDGMRTALRSAMRRANHPVVYAAGHEHSLQVLADPGGFVSLVSGSASKTTGVTKGLNTRFKHSHLGYMRLDVLTGGRLTLTVVEPDEAGNRQIVYAAPIAAAVPD